MFSNRERHFGSWLGTSRQCAVRAACALCHFSCTALWEQLLPRRLCSFLSPSVHSLWRDVGTCLRSHYLVLSGRGRTRTHICWRPKCMPLTPWAVCLRSVFSRAHMFLLFFQVLLPCFPDQGKGLRVRRSYPYNLVFQFFRFPMYLEILSLLPPS